MSALMNIDNFGPDELALLQNMILSKQAASLQREVEQLKLNGLKMLERLDKQDQRIGNLDKIEPSGDEQQQLVKMVNRFSGQSGISFQQGWREFKGAFNLSFRTNITSLIENYKEKHGLDKLTVPQYLSMNGRLEDGIRVVDKMLQELEDGH